MFRSIFRPYGLVWTVLNHVTDVLALSILWCFCCLPVVTIGPATVALYDAAVHGVRYGEEEVYRRYFRTFRAELKNGIFVTVLWGAVLVFCSYVLALLDEAGAADSRAALLAGGYRFLTLIPLAAGCWSAVILSRFTYRFRELTATALLYLPHHPIASAMISILTWVVFHYCLEYPLGLTFAPALCALGWSVPAERVFEKYGAGVKREKAEAAEE